MRTPKQLYAQQRLIYQPELLTCPHCGDLLVMCNYLVWNKTVQTLDRVLSVASRPGRCPNETCAGSRLRLLSAEAQSIALPHSTYGYDVLVRIGWWRYQHHATYREIHAELASHVRISVAHVSYLYQQVYLPLLACHERQHRDRPGADRQGPRRLDHRSGWPGSRRRRAATLLHSRAHRGLTLRSGWLSQQDQPTFEAFLRPLKSLEWPILAVLSDKQTGLMPAVATVLPEESLSVLSGPLSPQLGRAPRRGRCGLQDGGCDKPCASTSATCSVTNPIRRLSQAGVLTVTGLVPSPLGPQEERTAPASQRQEPRAFPTAPEPAGPRRSSRNSCATPATCSHSKAGLPCGWRAWRPTSASSAWPVSVSTCWPRTMTRAWLNCIAVSGRCQRLRGNVAKRAR